MNLGDPHEGSFGSFNIENRREIYGDDFTSMERLFRHAFPRMPHHTYISCWHLGERESMAMWEIYAARGRGLAVRTTMSRLVQALSYDEGSVVGSTVSYVDKSETYIPEGNLFSSFVQKHDAYEYENEFRLMIIDVLREMTKRVG